MKNMDVVMKKNFFKGFYKENINYIEFFNEKVMLLNYILGIIGFSKGVMIMGNNLVGNVIFGICIEFLKKGEKVFFFFFLVYVYGCVFDFLIVMVVGIYVILLGKIFFFKILMKVFEEVKFNFIIIVLLVIEKIYKNVI